MIKNTKIIQNKISTENKTSSIKKKNSIQSIVLEEENIINENKIRKKKQCLLFVESPGKCSTIQKYLNEDSDFTYEVIATYGHIKQLPSKNGSVTIENDKVNFLWEDKIESVKRIKNILQKQKYDTYYIATDKDREGEGIAFHIFNLLQETITNANIFRITFNEITKKALQTSIQNPRKVDDNLVHAFLSRLAMDYLIGYTLSPLTWQLGKYSVGRVQSPSVRLIIDQEMEIFNFVSTTYWTLDGIFEDLNIKAKTLSFLPQAYKDLTQEEFITYLTTENNDIKKIMREDITDNIIEILSLETNKIYYVDTIIEKDVYRSPDAPFITATLQQESNVKLGFSVMTTMHHAQKLYENGLITYMRTDSTTINNDTISLIRSYILQEFGDDYLSKEQNLYKSKDKNIQEAHEAIRPTDITNNGDNIEDPMSQKLYQLIWKKTIASQMSKCLYKKKDITIKNNICSMSFSGSQLVFLGYLKVYGREEDEDALLPDLQLNHELVLQNIEKNIHHTKHPARYTEGGLIKQLKKEGIGRPSTYVSIIEILKKREYIRMDGKNLIGVVKGKILIAFLETFFPKYIDYQFTAHMEETLDQIANGEINWTEILCRFYKELKEAHTKVITFNLFEKLDKMNLKLQQWLKNKICEKCSSNYNLYIKTNLFFCCSNKSCGNTLPLKDDFIFVPKSADDTSETKNIYTKFKKFTKKKFVLYKKKDNS
jgi:DNA topoisomerase I